MSQFPTTKEWDTLSDLLVMVADLPLPTWKEKKAHAKANLSLSALLALSEILSWEWEEE